MRILLDHNTPAPLRYALQGHQVETAYEKGWAELLNGDLIEAAEADGFDVLITTDKGIRYEQNWIGRRLSLLVLSTNDWTRIRRAKSLVVAAVSSMQAATIAEVEIPLV
jgi:predicted nuclease of predicted toxin-antitoxin system